MASSNGVDVGVQVPAEDDGRKKSRAQQVVRWRDRIRTAVRSRDAYAKAKGWDKFIDEYKGIWDIRIKNIKVPPVNEVFAYVDADVSQLSFKNPYINSNPRKASTAAAAAILEADVNYTYRLLNVKNETDKELVEADLIGHSWHKTGTITTVEGKDNKAEEPLKATEQIFSMHVPYKDIVFNIGAVRPPEDCQWIAHRIMRPLADVKEKYGVPDLKGSRHPRLTDKDEAHVDFKDDILFAILWEIWDAKTRRVYLICEESGVEKYLKDVPWPEHKRTFPFRMLSFYDSVDEPYPLSGVSQWEPQVVEESKLVAMMLNHAKRWNRQLIIKDQTLTPEEMEKFEQGIDGSIVQHQADDIRKDAMFADYGSMPADFTLLLGALAQLRRSISGQPELSRGANTKTQSRTLGELQLIEGGAQNRLSRRISRFEEHLSVIGQDILSEIQASLNIERVATIVDETPQEIVQAFAQAGHLNLQTGQIAYRPEEITGEFDVRVRAGSTLPMNKQTRMAILESMLKIGAGIESPVPPFMQLVITELFRDFEMPHLRRAFVQQNQQELMKKAQEQSTEDAEKAKAVSQAIKNQAAAEKTETETQGMRARQSLPLALQIALENRGKGGGK